MTEQASFRITTVETSALARQLDCGTTAEELDDALSDAGYVRLDHGSAPSEMTAFLAADRPAGRDPGHRAVMLETLRALIHVAEANGPINSTKAVIVHDAALRLAATDPVGEWLADVNLAYRRDRQSVALLPLGKIATPIIQIAAEAYKVALQDGLMNDVAFERCMTVGGDGPEWEQSMWAVHPPQQPMVKVKRNDPKALQLLGIDPAIAELVTWVQTHPDVDVQRFAAYAENLGLDRKTMAEGIAKTRLLAPEMVARLTAEAPPRS